MREGRAVGRVSSAASPGRVNRMIDRGVIRAWSYVATAGVGFVGGGVCGVVTALSR
jgi:hypothetical protein